jgi:hypothetical protein
MTNGAEAVITSQQSLMKKNRITKLQQADNTLGQH